MLRPLVQLQTAFLNRFYSGTSSTVAAAHASHYFGATKIRRLLGDDFVKRIQGKTVLDFGCGPGHESVGLAQLGAAKVIGLDIREDVLREARAQARQLNLPNVIFTTESPELVDIVVSLDAFEHFANPKAILDTMYSLLKPGGVVEFSFGPTWYHPNGGHLFSVFPWSHLLLSEEALIRWRSGFKDDGATRFGEVAGGLNQMTIARFEALVKDSPFNLLSIELVPIRKLRMFHNRLTREFFTAVVRCRLQKPLSN